MATKLKTKEVTDILSTLKNFCVGETEMVLTSASHVDTKTWSTRCGQLRKGGLLQGTYSFIHCDDPDGTVIIRKR